MHDPATFTRRRFALKTTGNARTLGTAMNACRAAEGLSNGPSTSESGRRFRCTFRMIWPALLLFQALAVGAETNAPAPSQRPRGSLTEGMAGYKYLCYVPAARTNTAQRLPLIVFLHGACPNDDLTKLRHFGPIKYGLTNADFRFIVVAPATARAWTLPALAQLLDHVQGTLPVDPDRVYVTGYSMGGHATWMLALAHPQRFAAIAPVAGAGNPQEAARKLKHLPVWIFHGQNDDVVPLAYGQGMAQALEAGGKVKTTFYPDKGHDVWDTPYAGPELYAWLLQQRRGGSPPTGAPSRADSRTTNAAVKPRTPLPR